VSKWNRKRCAIGAAVIACVLMATISLRGEESVLVVDRERPRTSATWRAGTPPARHVLPRGAARADPLPARTDEELAAATTIVSIAPDLRPGEAPLPRLPQAELSLGVEALRQRALERWKPKARAKMSKCAGAADRKLVEVELMLRPTPRAAGVPTQMLHVDWVSAPPRVLRELAGRLDPVELQACLQAARGLAFSVPLSGGALAHAFPSSLETLSIEL
jgi:hypothetical protein